jgi:tetratricopeptide (TPR) repeat protein
MYLNSQNYDGAAAQLNKAYEIDSKNGLVLANIGALARAKGDLVSARKYYQQAADNGANTFYNIGVLDIKAGNYSAAVNNFTKSGKSDFNVALAQLLNGNAAGAKTTIDNLNPDDLTWEHYYLRAICGARMNSQDVCTTNLAQAVAKNGTARTMAKDDVEFRRFFSNPLFEAAIR